MFIDTHAHLNFEAFNKDLNEVINRATKNGVKKIIIPGAKLDSSIKGIKIAQKHPSCYATVGIHPHHVGEYSATLLHSNMLSQFSDSLFRLVQEKKVVAVGEIGLDYHTYHDYPAPDENIRNLQKKLLLFQLHLACEKNLPVILHCREAYDEMLELLEQFLKKKSLKGVFHCFAGNIEHLRHVLTMGFYVGFDGNLTYPKNEPLRNLLTKTPLEKLLTETDSPYLSPLSKRGQRNEPANMGEINAFFAGVKKISLEKLNSQVYSNAALLFQLREPLC